MADAVDISQYLPNEQEEAVAARWEGDATIALLDGQVVPKDRLMREVRNLREIANSFPASSTLSILVEDNESALQLMEALHDIGMSYVYGRYKCFEVKDTGAVISVKWKDA